MKLHSSSKIVLYYGEVYKVPNKTNWLTVDRNAVKAHKDKLVITKLDLWNSHKYTTLDIQVKDISGWQDSLLNVEQDMTWMLEFKGSLIGKLTAEELIKLYPQLTQETLEYCSRNFHIPDLLYKKLSKLL